MPLGNSVRGSPPWDNRHPLEHRCGRRSTAELLSPEQLDDPNPKCGYRLGATAPGSIATATFRSRRATTEGGRSCTRVIPSTYVLVVELSQVSPYDIPLPS